MMLLYFLFLEPGLWIRIRHDPSVPFRAIRTLLIGLFLFTFCKFFNLLGGRVHRKYFSLKGTVQREKMGQLCPWRLWTLPDLRPAF